MKKLLPILPLLVSITCLSQKKTQDIYLKMDGEIAKDYTQCKPVTIKRCNWGFKTTFVADTTIHIVYLRERLIKDSCYFVANYLLKPKK